MFPRFPRLIKHAFLILLLSLAASTPVFCTETIQIGGTGGGLAAVKLLAAEFERNHTGTKITVLPSLGSSGGIKAVLSGAIDIGLSATVLNEAERGVVAQEFARTPFIFAVHKNNRMTKITSDALVSIYAGKMTKWPDLTPIRLVLRPPTEYDNALLKQISGDMEHAVKSALARDGMIVEITDQESARAIERIPGAFGTITLGQMLAEKCMLKPLSVNGVKPAVNTIIDGSYPFFKTYYIVTKAEIRPAVREFIDFMYSAAGIAVVRRVGYVVTPR